MISFVLLIHRCLLNIYCFLGDILEKQGPFLTELAIYWGMGTDINIKLYKRVDKRESDKVGWRGGGRGKTLQALVGHEDFELYPKSTRPSLEKLFSVTAKSMVLGATQSECKSWLSHCLAVRL